MSRQEHQMERRVRLLKEAFQADVKRLVQYLKTDEGRMAFQKPLTRDEQLARWMIPEIRNEILFQKMVEGGPSAVEAYAKRMEKLMRGQEHGGRRK